MCLTGCLRYSGNLNDCVYDPKEHQPCSWVVPHEPLPVLRAMQPHLESGCGVNVKELTHPGDTRQPSISELTLVFVLRRVPERDEMIALTLLRFLA